MNRKLWGALLAAALLGSLSGCGDEDRGDRPPSATPAAAEPEVTAEPAGSPEPPPPTTGGLDVTRIELPVEGGSLAASGKAVWSVPHKDQLALRIDAETGKVTDEVELPGVGAELAADRDMVWASVSTPGSFEPQGLVRIDPGTREVVAEVDVPAVFPQIHDGRVWAAGQDGRLYGIDPKSNRVVKRLKVSKEAFRYAISGPYAWIATAEEVKRVDIAGGAAKDFSGLLRGLPEAYDGPERLVPAVTAQGLLWAVTAKALLGIDPETGAVQARVKAPRRSTFLPEAILHEGDVWLFAMDDEALLHLVAVDPKRERIGERYTIEAAPEFGFTGGAGYLWLPEAGLPSLLRLEPRRG